MTGGDLRSARGSLGAGSSARSLPIAFGACARDTVGPSDRGLPILFGAWTCVPVYGGILGLDSVLELQMTVTFGVL